eukprot:4700034-Pyramimonas_sp.AAC.1
MSMCTVVIRAMMWYVTHLAKRVPALRPWTIDLVGSKGAEYAPAWRTQREAMHCSSSSPRISAGKLSLSAV